MQDNVKATKLFENIISGINFDISKYYQKPPHLQLLTKWMADNLLLS